MPNFDPTRKDLMRVLQTYRSMVTAEADKHCFRFYRECAIYWFASNYHLGQSSNLYSVLSTSPYPVEVGETFESAITEGSMEKIMYDDLLEYFIRSK